MSKKVSSLTTRRAKMEKRDVGAVHATDAFAGGEDWVGEFSLESLVKEDGSAVSESELLSANEASSPNATAGDYRAVFTAMGATKIILYNSSSSAGDWEFLVKRGPHWFWASQEIRFPLAGMRYSIGADPVESGYVDDEVEAAISEQDEGYFLRAE